MINFFETLFEARERKFQQEKLFRGESVDLVARITTDGVLDQLSDYQISGVYQPTDNLSGPFYPMDAEIVDGKAILHWTGDNDFGKTSYNVWGLLTKDGKAAYPVCWRLNMAHSPSYPVSSVDPIPRTIDFSQYDLLNAPWIELSAFDEFVDGLSNDYLPLSGGTVSGDFAVENFLSSTSSGVFLGKNQDLNQYAEIAIGNNLSVGMVGLAIGSNSEAQNNGITIGHSAKSPYGGGNIVIGNGASTAANGTTVVGTNAKASGGNAIAIGTAANATHSGEVRLGGTQRNLEPQLWLFETPIISGPDTSILPERIPYLSAYAKNEDLADYATQEWVNEQIDQLSDVYVKKDNIDFLSTDYAGLPDLNNISLFDISHKLNFCIQAISGKKIPHGNLPPDAQYTYVVMADGTQLLDDGTELSDIQEGTLDSFARHNGYSGSNDIRAVVLGSGVEAVGHHAFAGFENLEMVDISRAQITFVEDRTFQYSPMLRYVDLGTSISAIGNTVFQHSYRLTELTLPESLVSAGIWSFNNGGIEKMIFTGRTKAQVQAMANYPWQMGGCTMVATDETWIA